MRLASDLISDIYDVGLAPERWPAMLERIADALGGSTAAMTKHNMTTSEGTAILARTDPRITRTYDDYYAARDVLWQRGRALPQARCGTDRMIMPRGEFIKSEFYNDYLTQLGVDSVLSAFAMKDESWAWVVSFGRARRQGEWDVEHIAFLGALLPHIGRAMQVNLRLEGARFDYEDMSDGLERLRRGVMIVDGESRPLFVNRAAAAILAEADGLHIGSGGLRSADPACTAALRHMIAAAANGRGAGGALSIARASPRRPYSLVVAPLPGRRGWFAHRRVRAIVFITDPERVHPQPQLHIQRLYGLTAAEAAVTMRILNGDGLQATADDLGIALATARTHLQRVFDKTGTHRQAELVRLVTEALTVT